jgi:hypothetical protein
LFFLNDASPEDIERVLKQAEQNKKVWNRWSEAIFKN